MLQVHLENGHQVAVSDFLDRMEQQGIQPNRVTFQHCIGFYCLEGNTSGATTILQHMKADRINLMQCTVQGGLL